MNEIKRKYFDECPSYKGEDHYIAWLENRLLLMTKSASEESKEKLAGFDAIELIRKTT